MWAIMTASFTVGMLSHVTLGLKVLGFGFGAFFGITVFLATILLVVLFGYYLPKAKKARKTREA
jgi:hypothetical protein